MVISSPPKILLIKSDISELAKVEKSVNELFYEFTISHKYFNKVFLCLSEAVLNAIQHGNKYDVNKKITVNINYLNECVVIKIKDEGEGFNFNKIIDPTIHGNIKKESGRGLHIIKSLSEKIEYNRKGNSIQFKIKCK